MLYLERSSSEPDWVPRYNFGSSRDGNNITNYIIKYSVPKRLKHCIIYPMCISEETKNPETDILVTVVFSVGCFFWCVLPGFVYT